MKKILILSMFAVLAAACSRDALETFPSTGVSKDFVYGDTDNARSALAATLTNLGTNSWDTSSANNSPIAFGHAIAGITADAMAEDYVLDNSGNGWMWVTYSYDFNSWYNDGRIQVTSLWNCYYTTINSCNELIATAELLLQTKEGKHMLGQAYALRALCYFMVSQFYARAYYYFPDDLCAPVYLEASNSTTQGASRSTNKVVYETVIMPDLDEAIRLLSEAEGEGAKRTDIQEISYAVACGIKARVALTMHRWADAREAAENALKSYAGKEVLTPAQIASGMNDVNQLPSVMWGMVVTTDNYGMYASYLAQMDANHNGYATSARRCCSAWLWNQLGADDARRAWWRGDFDNNDYAESGWDIRYCQTKFRFPSAESWLGDEIHMRAEEMLLTIAEAYCQEGNDAQARIYLKQLMAQRDPNYTRADSKSGNALGTLTAGSDGATATGSLLEEILIQRRIELWGEYGRIFDIKRLHQGFKRVASTTDDNPGFDPSSLLANFNTTNPDSYAWVFLLPQLELDGNPNIVDQQNPIEKAE